MSNITIPELELFNPNKDSCNNYLVISSGDEGTKKITVGDLLGLARRKVGCQYCHQPTYIDLACDYCGAPPRYKEHKDANLP